MLHLSITAMVRRMVLVFAWVFVGLVVGLCNGHGRCARGRPFNQLVEFAPVKPDAPTLWTVVDFNALAFGLQETGFRTDGTFHKWQSVRW